MKRIVFLIALFLAASCNREQLAQPQFVEWAFDTQYSKASLSESGVFSWKQGDRIAVWNATSGAFVPFTTIAGKGRFTAMAPENASFSAAAFYPADIAGSPSYVMLPASYSSADLASAAFPMYASVSQGDQTLHFKHLGAMITVTVSRLQPEVTRLELRSGATLLSGRFDLSSDSGNQVIRQVSGNGSVVVSLSLSQEGTLSVTLPVPTGTYPISVCLGNDAEHEMLLLSSSGNLSFERANRYKLKPFDYMVERFAFESGEPVESLGIENDSQNWE